MYLLKLEKNRILESYKLNGSSANERIVCTFDSYDQTIVLL